MANIKSAIKNIRKTEARTVRNRAAKSRLKTLAKKVTAAAAGEDKAAAKAAAIAYVSAMDKAAKTSIIHPNVASRAKAKVSQYLGA